MSLEEEVSQYFCNELDLLVPFNPDTELLQPSPAAEMLPRFENIFKLDNSSISTASPPLGYDCTTSVGANPGLNEMWPNKGTLQLSINLEQNQPTKRRKRRRRNESGSSSSATKPTPKWKCDPTDPTITESERRSIKKAQKCRQQRNRKAENEAELKGENNQLRVENKRLNDENVDLRQEKQVLQALVQMYQSKLAEPIVIELQVVQF